MIRRKNEHSESSRLKVNKNPNLKGTYLYRIVFFSFKKRTTIPHQIRGFPVISQNLITKKWGLFLQWELEL